MSHIRNERRKITQVAQRGKLQTAAQVRLGVGYNVICINM